MNDDDDLLSYELANYQLRTLPGGIRLHVLGTGKYRGTQFAAALAIEFGAVDRHLVGPRGRPRELPSGLAHFLEHLLLRRLQRRVGLKQLKFERTDSLDFEVLVDFLNAQTTDDRTLLWTYGLTGTAVITSIRMALHALLSAIAPGPLWPPPSSERAKEESVIREEANGHADIPRLAMQACFRRAVFHGPLRDGAFGNVERLHEIDGETINLALDIARARIGAIFVTCSDASAQMADDIADVVVKSLANAGRRRASFNRISTKEDCTSVANRFAIGTAKNLRTELIMCGLKLEPLRERFPRVDEFARTYALFRHLSGASAAWIMRDATVLATAARVPDDLWFIDEAEQRQAISRCLDGMRLSIDHLRRIVEFGFVGHGGGFYATYLQRTLKKLRLCVDADAFGCRFDELISGVALVSVSDVDKLSDWINGCEAISLMYYGSRGDEMRKLHDLLLQS